MVETTCLWGILHRFCLLKQKKTLEQKQNSVYSFAETFFFMYLRSRSSVQKEAQLIWQKTTSNDFRSEGLHSAKLQLPSTDQLLLKILDN